MAKLFIGIGASFPYDIEVKRKNVDGAIAAMGAICALCDISPLYEAEAWPDPEGPKYLNGVLSATSSLPPDAILAALLAIEAGYGRVRSDDPALRYAPRTLDLDLLAVDDIVCETPFLQLPHPRMEERAFVMRPLAEIAPDWRHPVTGRQALAVADSLADRGLKRLDLSSRQG